MVFVAELIYQPVVGGGLSNEEAVGDRVNVTITVGVANGEGVFYYARRCSIGDRERVRFEVANREEGHGVPNSHEEAVGDGIVCPVAIGVAKWESVSKWSRLASNVSVPLAEKGISVPNNRSSNSKARGNGVDLSVAVGIADRMLVNDASTGACQETYCPVFFAVVCFPCPFCVFATGLCLAGVCRPVTVVVTRADSPCGDGVRHLDGVELVTSVVAPSQLYPMGRVIIHVRPKDRGSGSGWR